MSTKELKEIIQDYKYKDLTLLEIYKRLSPLSSYGQFSESVRNEIAQLLIAYRWNSKSLDDTVKQLENLMWCPNSSTNSTEEYRLRLLEEAVKALGISRNNP